MLLVTADALAAAAATLIARVWAFGLGPADLHVRSVQIPYTAAVLITVPAWLFLLTLARCYDMGPFGSVAAGTRRIIGAGAHLLASVAVAYYVINLERLGRDFLIAIVPLAVLLTLLGRAGVDRRLDRQRDRHRAMRKAVVIGSRHNVRAVSDHFADHPRGGARVVAELITDDDLDTNDDNPSDAPVTAPDTAAVLRALETVAADLVVITGELAPGELRRLSWRMEGTGIAVLVAPAATQLTEPQLDVRPVAGLPLLYVNRPGVPIERSAGTPTGRPDPSSPDEADAATRR